MLGLAIRDSIPRFVSFCLEMHINVSKMDNLRGRYGMQRQELTCVVASFVYICARNSA